MMESEDRKSDAPKPWWKSKTVWINVGLAVIAWLLENTGIIQSLVGDHWYDVVIAAIALVNLVLRKVTTGPIYISHPGELEQKT